MIVPILTINPVGLKRLHDTFDLAEQFEDKFANMMVAVGAMIRDQAANHVSAVSSRVAAGMTMDVEQQRDEYIVTVRSSFEGYPRYPGDMVGDAAEAEARGWTTLAHRFHYGYSGTNNRAGFTAPTPFLEPYFEHHSKAFFKFVSETLMAQVLRGY